MALGKKSKFTTSARTRAHRTKAPKSARKMRACSAVTLRHTPRARVSIEFLGTRYEAPSRVIGEIQRKLSVYKQEPGKTVSVDAFLKDVQGDLPDWAMYFRGIRQRQDFTQKQMAEALGLTQSNISDIERGRRSIGKVLAKKIAEKFNAEYRLLL